MGCQGECDWEDLPWKKEDLASWLIKHGGVVHHATRAKASLGKFISNFLFYFILCSRALALRASSKECFTRCLVVLLCSRCYSVREIDGEMMALFSFWAVLNVDPEQHVMVTWKSIVTRSLSLSKRPLGSHCLQQDLAHWHYHSRYGMAMWLIACRVERKERHTILIKSYQKERNKRGIPAGICTAEYQCTYTLHLTPNTSLCTREQSTFRQYAVDSRTDDPVKSSQFKGRIVSEREPVGT